MLSFCFNLLMLITFAKILDLTSSSFLISLIIVLSSSLLKSIGNVLINSPTLFSISGTFISRPESTRPKVTLDFLDRWLIIYPHR